MMKKTASLFILLAMCICSPAQTSISNIVNSYAEITGYKPCNNTVTVGDGSLFSAGDYILMIQMKGASLNTANNPTFGTVASYNGAGNYEFNTIASINGNIITLKNVPVKTYDVPAGAVQLIKVPVYATDASVTGLLTCPAWDGAKGGVLVIKVNNELSLHANIDVSGKGFRGGKLCANPDGGCASGNTDYFYTVSSGLGAEKGEGIAATQSSMNGGRGAWGNAGGGGNKHNSGGGGGGNFSAGGRGGNEANFCPGAIIGGEAGKAMDYSNGRLFLGGGGGCADYNNAVGTFGSDGGGIVIIDAAKISGNGFGILSNGVDVGVIPNGIGDGAGGAGAGGTVLISCNNINGTLNVIANGGHGGDENTTYTSCFGPGGGGGTGAILFSAGSLPAGVSATADAGRAGNNVNPGSCSQPAYGAADGAISSGPLFNQTLVKSTAVFVSAQNIKSTIQKCSNENITLNARTGTVYSWVPATDLSAANLQHPDCSTTANKTYIVTITNNTCNYIDTFDIVIKQPLTPLFTPIPEICPGTVPPALPAASADVIPITGTWSPNIINTGIAGPGIYTFTPDAGQCAFSVPFTVTIKETVPRFTPIVDLCLGSVPPVLPAASEDPVPITGTWSPALVGTEAIGSFVYTFTPSAGVCASLAEMTINVVQKTIPLFSLKNISLCPDSNIVLNPGVYRSYLWQDNTALPTYLVTEPGIYSVIVKGADGCTITDTITVSALANCTDVYFATAFSPNGNNSNNKTYGPLGNLIAMSNYRMEIYDRQGAVVFRSINPYEKWDGTYKGKAAGFGNYVCVASYTYKGTIKKTIRRNVLLIR